jgi:hypothetical protein
MLSRAGILAVIAALMVTVLPLASQAKSATDSYKEYQAAYAKAKSFNDILPFMSKAQVTAFNAIPEAQRKSMWEMTRSMDPTDVKVVKETATPTGATLDLTGVGSDKKPVKGTVQLVKEGGAWKISKEDWQL